MDAERLTGIMVAQKAQMANPLAATKRANGNAAQFRRHQTTRADGERPP
jgi:hypothetical protein